MKFGQLLDEQAVPEWRLHYFAYEAFKAKVKDDDFSSSLVQEVGRLAAFAREQRVAQKQHIDDLAARWKTIAEWKKSNFPDVDQHVATVHRQVLDAGVEVDKLLDFITLNVTAIRKICKKHDRVSGQNSTGAILTRLQLDEETGYLGELSSINQIEAIVAALKELVGEIEPLLAKPAHSTSLRGARDFYAIPVRPVSASLESSGSSDRLRMEAAQQAAAARELKARSLLTLLSLPLMIPNDDESLFVPKLTIAIALAGPLLAGAISGAFLNSLQALAPVDQVVQRILLFSLGGLTGSWSESKYTMTTLAAAGCVGSFLLHGTGLVYVGCWLLGVGVGAWISKFPRQLAVGTSPVVRCGVALAPMVGMVVGAMFTPRAIVAQLALSWFVFTLLVLAHERRAADGEAGVTDSESEAPESSNNNMNGTSTLPGARLAAARTSMVWSSLASLGLVRWGRTQIVFTVVCYGGPRVLTLCLASLAAAPTAAVVPAWMCSALSCISVLVLFDPSAMGWFWADAATKADLALVPKEWASTTDTVIATADAFAALALLAVYGAQVDNPASALALFSAVLLAAAFLGRMIADRL